MCKWNFRSIVYPRLFGHLTAAKIQVNFSAFRNFFEYLSNFHAFSIRSSKNRSLHEFPLIFMDFWYDIFDEVRKIFEKFRKATMRTRPLILSSSIGISIVYSRIGTDHCSLKFFFVYFRKQLDFKMTVIPIKICRQTGPYGSVPQNRFWFVPNCEWSIGVHANSAAHEMPSIGNIRRKINVRDPVRACGGGRALEKSTPLLHHQHFHPILILPKHTKLRIW